MPLDHHESLLKVVTVNYLGGGQGFSYLPSNLQVNYSNHVITHVVYLFILVFFPLCNHHVTQLITWQKIGTLQPQ